MAVTKIMLVDDYELARRGLSSMLEMEPDIQVLGTFSSAEELLQHPQLYEADVVLMDIKLPGMDGIKAIQHVKDVNPQIKVIMVSSYSDELPHLALREGADGYLTKGARQVELVNAIRATLEGGMPLDPSINRQIWGLDDCHLSNRQAQILDLAKEGTSNIEIAAALNISEQTVKNHMTNIFERLDVRDRTEAVVKALRNGIISLRHESEPLQVA